MKKPCQCNTAVIRNTDDLSYEQFCAIHGTFYVHRNGDTLESPGRKMDRMKRKLFCTVCKQHFHDFYKEFGGKIKCDKCRDKGSTIEIERIAPSRTNNNTPWRNYVRYKDKDKDAENRGVE